MANKNDIDTAITMAEAETGVQGGQKSIPLCFNPSAKKQTRRWSEKDEEFLRKNYRKISEKQLAEILRRTAASVRIKIKRDMHMVSMSMDKDILTAEHIAIGFGCCGKSIHSLMNKGLMPSRRLPVPRVIRVIDRLIFMKWLVDPGNWLYFKLDQVGALRRRGKRAISQCYDFTFWEDARNIVLKARNEWKDEWLTPGQVTKILKINPRQYKPRKIGGKIPGSKYVNLAIQKGNLKAKRRGNWRILKSDLPGPGKTINFRGDIVNIKR